MAGVVKRPSRAAKMTNELRNMKAQDIGTLSAAHEAVSRADKKRFMASGVIVTLTNLSGVTIAEPFTVADGLSDETIRALQADIRATYEYRLAVNKIKEPGK